MTTINDMIKKGKVRVNPANPFEISYDSDLLITKEAYDEYTKNVWEEDPDAYKYRKQGECDTEYKNRMLDKSNSTKSDATIESVCDALKEFLLAKNKNYGNSATEPLNIFSNLSNIERMKCRMDEKISRIKNSPCDRVNDYVDLLGYLVLVCKLNGWNSFMDMVD